MSKAEYLVKIAAATSLDEIVALTDQLDTDGLLTDAEAMSLIDPLADRLLEVL